MNLFRYRRMTISTAVIALICLLTLTGCGAAGTGAAASAESSGSGNSLVSQWEAIPDQNAQPEESTEISTSPADTDDTNIDASGANSADTASVEDSSENASETASENAEDASTVSTVSAETAAPAGIDGTMKGSDELVSLMTDFMTQRGLNSSNYAVAYENLATGETFYYNELKQWDACSTYKFPLNLLYYDMEAAGQITEDTIIPGTNTPLSECHHQSLQYSNNELSEAMVNNLGAYDVMKQNMRKYFTLTDAEIDSSYYHHNYFCARMMMDCSAYLYNHQSEYPDALGYLEAAQPGEYFRTYITDCTIAQKYGLRDGYNHDAGIIFGSTPFVLSVYTCNAGGNELIGRTAELFYNYTEQ